MRPANRLRSSQSIRRVLDAGQRVQRRDLVVCYADGQGPTARVALAVPRRLGGAVVRNRLKRKLRAALHPLMGTIGPLDLVVIARAGAVDVPVETLTQALSEALSAIPSRKDAGDG